MAITPPLTGLPGQPAPGGNVAPAATPAKPATAATHKLGLGLLVALVVGSIIGSGVFGLPQNMAAGAGAGAIVIGWLITGVGMLALALTYQMLATARPALDNGVFAYARAVGGDYLGFNAAWGYWVSAWIGNVGYLVAAFGALGAGTHRGTAHRAGPVGAAVDLHGPLRRAACHVCAHQL